MFKISLLTFALFATLACAAPVAQRDGDGHTGDATYFEPGLGACGNRNTSEDLMVAVSAEFFNSFGAETNGNPICGRQIEATGPDGQKTVVATVEDKCMGCKPDDLDFTLAAFKYLAEPSVGRLHGTTWKLLPLSSGES